jgi:ribosome biogenesis GTPase
LRKRGLAVTDRLGDGGALPPICSGTVIARHGRNLLVHAECDDSAHHRQAVTRGRRDDFCVGDRVRLRPIASDQAVIEAIETRRNCVSRSDGGRTKLLAANVDQAAVVISGEPAFSEPLLMRALAVLHTEGIAPLIIATKSDLQEASLRIATRLARYASLGYPVIPLSVSTAPERSLEILRPVLEGRRTLLLGQSGMGKSTLVNLLVPDAAQATREISVALSTGRHTTSFCRMFPVQVWNDRSPAALGASGSWVIDSPGFQLFGIAHLSSSQLMHALPDFAPRLGECRFSNCLHLDEPGCAVRETLQRVDPLRWHFYRELLVETERAPR